MPSPFAAMVEDYDDPRDRQLKDSPPVHDALRHTSPGSDPYITLIVEILMLFVVFVVAEGVVHVVEDVINTDVNSDGADISLNYQITLIFL